MGQYPCTVSVVLVIHVAGYLGLIVVYLITYSVPVDKMLGCELL